MQSPWGKSLPYLGNIQKYQKHYKQRRVEERGYCSGWHLELLVESLKVEVDLSVLLLPVLLYLHTVLKDR